MGKISKRAVDGLLAKDRPFTFWDDELRGFGIRVMPTGTKTYVLQGRVNRKQFMYKIGRHGPLTPEQARTEAIKHLASIATGGNPIDERQAKRQASTFAELVPDFLEAKAKGDDGRPPRRASTLSDYKRYLERYSKRLATFTVADLSADDVDDQITRVKKDHGIAVARA